MLKLTLLIILFSASAIYAQLPTDGVMGLRGDYKITRDNNTGDFQITFISTPKIDQANNGIGSMIWDFLFGSDGEVTNSHTARTSQDFNNLHQMLAQERTFKVNLSGALWDAQGENAIETLLYRICHDAQIHIKVRSISANSIDLYDIDCPGFSDMASTRYSGNEYDSEGRNIGGKNSNGANKATH